MRFAIASKSVTAGLAVVLLSGAAAVETGSFLRAQEQPAAQDKAQEKTNAGDKAEATKLEGAKPRTHAKEGTKQAVEARLKAAEHAKPTDATGPIHDVEKTLFATRRFEQAAISPDGKRVAWVETLIGKNGAPSGNTAIYFSQIEAKTPRRLKAGLRQLYVANVSGRDGSVTSAETRKLTNVTGFLATPSWSPDGKTVAVLF